MTLTNKKKLYIAQLAPIWTCELELPLSTLAIRIPTLTWKSRLFFTWPNPSAPNFISNFLNTSTSSCTTCPLLAFLWIPNPHKLKHRWPRNHAWSLGQHSYSFHLSYSTHDGQRWKALIQILQIYIVYTLYAFKFTCCQ